MGNYYQGAYTGAEMDAGIAAANAAAPQATTYTKTEVDTALSAKVDAVSGKGLSTNDFTDADVTKLSGIAAGAEVNVQSDWTQSDTSADDFIKNKPTLGTAAAANTTTSIASGGTGLPTSGTVYTDQQRQDEEIASLVDRGAKNKLDLKKYDGTYDGVQWTDNGDGTFTLNRVSDGTINVWYPLGTITLEPGTYVLSGVPVNGLDSTRLKLSDDHGWNNANGVSASKTFSAQTTVTIYINWSVNADISNVTIKPMVCAAEDYAASTAFQPYAPTNRELYEMILAIQNGG